MVGLLLLKQLESLSDEAVVARWVQNPYHQYFCGMTQFQWALPCDPGELVYLRRRIGEQGVALILAVSARLHGEQAAEPTVVVDSTVQAKNVTWPTDTKLHHKIIRRCWKLADAHGVRRRRRSRAGGNKGGVNTPVGLDGLQQSLHLLKLLLGPAEL